MDLVASVEHGPAPGETLLGKNFAMFPGGKGANQAVCAARLGGDVGLIARLGQDAFAEQLRHGLREAGVATGSVRDVPGSSGVAVITVTRAGGNSIVVVPGANAALQPADLGEHRDELCASAILLTQLETPIETAEQLGAIAEQCRIPFLLDPAPAQPLPGSLRKRITWLTPNERETCTLLEHLGFPCTEEALGNEVLPKAAERLLAAGVRNVILKLGARGVYLQGADVAPTLIPACSVQAVDTTAAGDAFNGGFAFALAERRLEPVAAARFACAVAAISATRAGAQPSMPTLAEVEELLHAG